MTDKNLAEPYLGAALEALARFPVTAKHIRSAAVSENVSFRVTTERDQDYVLRLHRPGYNSLAELESERLWRDALAAEGLNVQRALETKDGRHFIPVTVVATGEQRYVSMVSWLPGKVLGDGHLAAANDMERQQIFRDIGRLTARIHNHAKAWQAPVAFERPSLNIDGLLGEQPRWGRFWEDAGLTRAHKTLLLTARDRLREVLSAYGVQPDNFSLTHADLHADNVLIDEEGKLGLIDFDDSAYGWHGYDLASALIEEQDSEDYPALLAALLAGYREQRPLEARDEAMLPVFLLLRGMALLGWVHERPEHADHGFFDNIRHRVLTQADILVGSR